jgi:PBP1b-binding outer membrane lipoprotein LpoB
MKRLMSIGLVAGCVLSFTGCSSLGPKPNQRATVESRPEAKTEPATPVSTDSHPGKIVQHMVNLFAAFLVGPEIADFSQSVAP